MTNGRRRAFVAASAVVALAAAPLAAPAAALARTRTQSTRTQSHRCETHRGKTTLEDRSARVFRWHGNVYACARPAGASVRLAPANDPYRGVFHRIRALQLQGRFLAWAEIDGSTLGAGEFLYVIDLRTGRRRTAGQAELDINDKIDSWVLGQGGVVLEVITHAGSDTRLFVSTSAGTRTLAEGSPGEFTSLAISPSGATVYWLDNGRPKSAAVS